ncbi:MAG: YolD-like family protein [Ruminococcus sp.]|nr:YolD-like family protein [Ruminococcus sp.]
MKTGLARSYFFSGTKYSDMIIFFDRAGRKIGEMPANGLPYLASGSAAAAENSEPSVYTEDGPTIAAYPSLGSFITSAIKSEDIVESGEQERITEPKRELSEDEADEVSNTLNKLTLRTTVKIRYYDVDEYTTIIGVVAEIDPPYRRLKVVKTTVSFDDIYSIELLGKSII